MNSANATYSNDGFIDDNGDEWFGNSILEKKKCNSCLLQNYLI